jgi:hypothetical protein
VTANFSRLDAETTRTWLTFPLNSSAFNTTVSPFAQRSQQYLKEQFGQANEKVGEQDYRLKQY